MVNQVQNVELHPIQKLLRSKEYEQMKQYFVCKMPGDTGDCGFMGTFSDMISHTAAHWHCHMFVCHVCSRQIHEYNEIYRHTDPATHQLCSATPREMTLNTSNRFGFVDLWKSRNVFIKQITKGEYLQKKSSKKRGTTATPMYDDEEEGRAVPQEDRFGYDNNNDNYSHKQQNHVPRTIGGGARNANLEPLGRQRGQSRVRWADESSPPRAPPGINPRGAYQRSQSRAPPLGDYQTPQNNRGRAGFGNSNSGGGGNGGSTTWNNNRNSNRNKSRGRESSGDFSGAGGAIRNRSPSDNFRAPNNRRPNYNNNPPDPRMSQGADSIYRNQNSRSPTPSRSSTSSSMFRSPTSSPVKSHSSSGFRSPLPSRDEPGSSSSYSQYGRSPPDYSRPPPSFPTSPLPTTESLNLNPPAVHRSPLPQNDEGFRVYCSPPPEEAPTAPAGGIMTRSQMAAAAKDPRGRAAAIAAIALKRKAPPTRTEEPEEPAGTIDLAIKKPDEMVRQRRSSIHYRSRSRGKSMSRDNSDDEQMKEIEKTRKMYQVQGKGTVKVLQNTNRMSSLLSNPLTNTTAKSRNSSLQNKQLPPKKTAKLDRLRARIMASQELASQRPAEAEPPHTPISTTFPLDSVANIPLPSPGPSVSKRYPTPPETPGSPQPVPPPAFPPGIAKRPRLQLGNNDDDDVEIID